MKKLFIYIVLVLTMISNTFVMDLWGERNISFAQGNEIKILMLGYFEYWEDGTKYKYDDAYGRHTVSDINMLYDVGFKTPGGVKGTGLLTLYAFRTIPLLIPVSLSICLIDKLLDSQKFSKIK